GLRVVRGASGTRHHAERPAGAPTDGPDPPIWFLAAPVGLAALALLGGPFAGALDMPLQRYAATLPGATPGIPIPEHAAHLALWHGFEPAFFLSLAIFAFGALVFWASIASGWSTAPRLVAFTAPDVYNAILRGIDRLSVVTTRVTQRGSLPVYVGTIFRSE